MKLFLGIGTGSKEQIFDIETNDLSIDVVDALPAVHALSGCDSTSSFSGMGKAVLQNRMQRRKVLQCSLNTWRK